MLLTHLSLTNFRSFSRLDLEVPGGPILLVGGNAQGKTSLLEAIYFLATLTSFHAESDRQLIHFLAIREPLAVSRIVGRFQKGGREHELEIRIILESNGLRGGARVRKEALLDGIKHKLNEAVGNFNAVLFLPQMLSIVEGSPRNRRRYLDLALAQVYPDYTAFLSTYGKVLTQRNALLKQIGETGGDPKQLEYWDEELTALGAYLIRARIHAVQEMGDLAALIHSDLTRQKEILRLDYRPAYDPLPAPNAQFSLQLDDPRDRTRFSLEQIQSGFQEALLEKRGEELARGVTVIGPHRDELRFLCNQVDLGTYGSRGQVRTTMLTLKLAEFSWMQAKSGYWPVMLLDEVLAELDDDRRSDLLDRVQDNRQSLLTTTDLDLFHASFIEKSKIWQITGGRVTAA